jgi:iron complex outermembrane recepter protein
LFFGLKKVCYKRLNLVIFCRFKALNPINSMNKFYSKSIVPLLLMVFGAASLMAQTTISGKVTDGTTKEALGGVNIVVKGKVIGTISNADGEFNLKVNQPPPFTLVFSFIGYRSQELEIKDAATGELNIVMEEESMLGQEVVVSASRVEESILKSPVTIEKMDILSIRQAATPDFYDALANVKGVQTSNGSLNFTAVNTRGFATIANTRFVQWVDGMDTQAPLLNFPTGSIMGVGELDSESVELIPGAASALYGPNAFNGIMIMKSKSPFDYQGLSAQVKQGIVSSDAGGSHPLGQYSIRYAKAFNNKFAFKINFSYMKTTDWLGNDYQTDRRNPESKVDLSGTNNFDGLNLYGDEVQITPGLPNVGTITRTGFREEDMLNAFGDNRDATTLKFDGALHYRINDKVEVLYNYRYGGGSSIYQGQEKYALRDFNQQFHKVEFKGDNFFVRGYQSITDAGKSYNLGALGIFANETYSPSATKWVPEYVLAMQGYFTSLGVPGGNPVAARSFADRDRPQPGTQAYNDLMNTVRSQLFQRNPPGATFSDNSTLTHAEFNYRFFNQIKWAEVQVGGNWRQYSLFSNGTIFNEGPDDGLNFSRINIGEFGVYTQIAKTFAEKLKLTGSIRFDKNENFEGQFTPRVSAVYELSKESNLRASFQTGFRNPDTQAQFIYFPSSGGILLGGTQANSERYGIMEGGAYTATSFNAFRASNGTLDPVTGAVLTGNASLLETATISYVKPEQLQSFDLGYKGLIASKLLVDLNGYYSIYTNFIGQQLIAGKNSTTHQGRRVDAGALWAPYTNLSQEVTSYGVGLGLSYSLPKTFVLNGNYSWAEFEAPGASADFQSNFNTPRNKVSVGISSRKIIENVGFNINYRWQDAFEWESSFGVWQVPQFGVVDAQVNYKVSSIKSLIKLGATNIGGGDYRTNIGAPFVGQQYYVSITFDQFLK